MLELRVWERPESRYGSMTPHATHLHALSLGRSTNFFNPVWTVDPKEASGSTPQLPRRNDDAQRDNNHAIAHLSWWELGGWLLAFVIFGYVACQSFSLPLEEGSEERFVPGDPQEPMLERVGGVTSRQVTFAHALEESAEDIAEDSRQNAPFTRNKGPLFLGGPSTAKRLGTGKPAQLQIALKSRADFEAEALRTALDRLAETTRRAYIGQLQWWQLFCARRQVPW